MLDVNVKPSPEDWSDRIETDEGLSEGERRDKLVDYREQIYSHIEEIKDETSDIITGLEEQIDKIDGELDE